MSSPTQPLEVMLQRVLHTEADEIDCDEFLARVAAYLEQLDDTASLSTELKAVSQHLAVCPECREEFDALRKAYEEEPS